MNFLILPGLYCRCDDGSDADYFYVLTRGCLA